jgi:hypothetical protein
VKPIAVIFALAALLAAAPAQAAEPRTCSEARQMCLQPFGRHCDQGCVATCRLRFNGCLKTGAFSTPGRLLQNLKRL